LITGQTKLLTTLMSVAAPAANAAATSSSLSKSPLPLLSNALDERDTTICDSGPAFAVAFPGGYSALEAMLQHLSVASTTTSSASADASST
jgi:hypothetical protein